MASENGITHSQMISAGAGAEYVKLLNKENEERDLFWSIDPENIRDDTEWIQHLQLVTDTQVAVMANVYKNAGAGCTGVADHPKVMDAIWRSCNALSVPGMSISRDHPLTSLVPSYVNAIGYNFNKLIIFKIGQQNIFTMNARTQMLLADISGRLQDLGKWVGFYKTRDQLIVASRQNQLYFTPLTGMPFNEDTGNAIAAGYVGMLKVEFVAQSAHLNELINWWGLANKNVSGQLPIPYNISTRDQLKANDFSMVLLTRCVFFWYDVRRYFMKGYIETLFKEYVPLITDFPVSPHTAGDHRVEIPVQIKGPCSGILIHLQSVSDISWNKTTRLTNERGQRYIKYAMLYTGNFYREDAVLASYYEYSHKELYPDQKNNQMLGHVFITLSHDWRCNQPKSFGDYTSTNELKLVLILYPHSEDLKLGAETIGWNGSYQETMAFGKVWQQ